MRRWPALVGFIGTALAAGAAGSRASTRAVRSDWYAGLQKPSFQPPPQLFGPVWSILYAQMGTSAWLVWDEARRDPAKRDDAREALAAWFVQLALNGAWSPVFFGRRSLGGGLVISSAMLPAIGTTAALSGRVSSLSRALYAPYLAWVSFATILNGRIWQLNRTR